MPLCYHISENFSGVITTKKGQLKGGIFLILAAVIWGLSFVAQSEGLEVIGTLTFNGIRMIMGGTVLLPVIAIMSGVQKSKNKNHTAANRIVRGGILFIHIMFSEIIFRKREHCFSG